MGCPGVQGLPMHGTVFRALEFDRVREALADVALTPLGRARALDLTPATDPVDVEARLALTAEAVAFLKQGGSLALARARRPRDHARGARRRRSAAGTTAAHRARSTPRIDRHRLVRDSPRTRRRQRIRVWSRSRSRAASFATRNGGSPSRDRRRRRRGGQCEPCPARHSRLASPAAHETALNARHA